MLAVAAAPLSADSNATDARLVDMWLHGRSEHTVRAYRRAVAQLAAFTGGMALRELTLSDLQGFADSLTGAASSRGQAIAAIKSLLSFGSKLGALPFNIGAVVTKPKSRDDLADCMLAMSASEALEVTKIKSAAGLLDRGRGIATARPFRSPHHTISQLALCGGGAWPRPGEISLAQHGVLYLYR